MCPFFAMENLGGLWKLLRHILIPITFIKHMLCSWDCGSCWINRWVKWSSFFWRFNNVIPNILLWIIQLYLLTSPLWRLSSAQKIMGFYFLLKKLNLGISKFFIKYMISQPIKKYCHSITNISSSKIGTCIYVSINLFYLELRYHA